MRGTARLYFGRAWAPRRGCLKSLAVRLLGGSVLVAAALTWPGGPAHAQCVTVGDTTNCTGNGTITNGIVLNPAPAPNINVFNITGNIAPGVGTIGIDAGTTADDSPLTIFVDIAPFEIITQGDDAHGISAQTGSLPLIFPTTGINSPISLTNRAAITTQGDDARGIFALTRRTGSPIDITNWGAITTYSQGAVGIDAEVQSDGGSVTIENYGAITTRGDLASGISVLTENPAGASNMHAELTNWGTIITHGRVAPGIFAEVFSPDSDVTLTNRGAIRTHNDGSHGIFALAGAGGSPINNSIDLENWGSIIIEGSQGLAPSRVSGIFAQANGEGGRIDLDNRGQITTLGNDVFGIYAQTSRNNMPIVLNNWGAITTEGQVTFDPAVLDRMSGIFAVTGAPDSPITINNWADVIANGAGSNGIGIRTLDMSSDVTINLRSGMVQGGAGDGSGIDLTNVLGASTLNVFAGATVTTLGDNAIEGGAGDETVNNWGTVTGNVDLAGGTNAFNNRAGGLFNAGPNVDLGGGNLSNAGTFAPGGIGTLQTTEVTGNLTQSGSGLLATDIMFGSLTADLTNVSGTSTLSGQVVPNIVNPGFTQPGTQQVTILTSAGGVTNAGLTVQDTAVLDYSLLFPDGFSVVLGVTADFSPSGLNRNQTALGENINAIQTAGGSAGFAPAVAGLVTIPDLAGLADAYDQLGPEIYLDNGIATLFSALDFTDDLMSCEVREGGNVFINEGQCLWVKGSGSWLDQDKTRETIAFDRNAIRVAGGGQVAIAPDWRLGMAIGYERSDLDALGGRENSDADTLHGGAALKYIFGDGLIAAAISGGQGWYDTTRYLAFGTFNGQTSADHDVSHLTGRLRGAYAFTNGAHYIKPLVDLNVSWVDIDGFTEKGGNGAALIVQGTDETVFSVSPAIEFGWQSALADGTLMRPYVRAGVTVFDDPEFTLTSSFAAVSGAPTFRTQVGTDDVVGDIAAGLDTLANDGSVLKVYYAGQFGEDTAQQSVGARASFLF